MIRQPKAQWHFISALLAWVIFTNGACWAQVATPQLENFDRVQNALPECWNVVSGNWRVRKGTLVADSLKSEAYITFGETSWQNYEVEASVTFRKVRDPSRWLSVLIRASHDGTTPWSQVPIRFNTTQQNGMEFAVRTPRYGWSIRRKAAATAPSRLNEPRRLKVTVRGSHVQGFLDGQLVIDSHFCIDRPTGCVGLGASGCVASFDDFSVLHLPRTSASPASSRQPCDIVAHRGFSEIAPENTLAAIREAINAGATGCEFDVYGSKDGTVVLMHDKTVNRTTNGTGPVTDLTMEQLRLLDAGSWKNKKYAGERIPTLTEALKLLKDSNCQPVIEIKMEGITQQVVDDIRTLDMIDEVTVIAFSENVAREIRELEPRITCAWLCSKTLSGTPTQQADWLETRARTCRAEILDLNFGMLSPALITELKQRGLGVWTWTVNEAVVMQALRQWGIDSITTDRPDLMPMRAAPRNEQSR